MKFKSTKEIGKILNKIIILLKIKIKDFNSQTKVLLFNQSISKKSF